MKTLTQLLFCLLTFVVFTTFTVMIVAGVALGVEWKRRTP